MNNEIKEILEYLKNNFYAYGETYIEEKCKIVTKKEKQQLLDYITNLQKENERLKNLCDKYEEEHNTTFKLWKMKMEQMPTYEEKIEMQKENQRLKEELNYTVSQVQHNQIVTKLCKEKEDYKSRCEKAIEYIKNNCCYLVDNDDKNLLNILGGGEE